MPTTADRHRSPHRPPTKEDQPKQVIGRFAPSPSGPLHFGSLVAALGSYLFAKKAGGRWLVRVEDLDPPREQPGAADDILRTLESHQLHWDGEIVYQSDRLHHYQQVLEELIEKDLVYACKCTRRQIQVLGGLYKGKCADRSLPLSGQVALRLRHGKGDYAFQDLIQGPCRFDADIAQEDFVIKRKDGLFAYQLAVVVDDIWQGVTQVVRGSDLLDSTPRQLRLYEVLQSAPPSYAHLPLVMNDDGNKYSKQNLAPAIDKRQASVQLYAALQFLRQDPPETLAQAPAQQVIEWAMAHWNPAVIPAEINEPWQPDAVLWRHHLNAD